jgi:hypothetical protein
MGNGFHEKTVSHYIGWAGEGQLVTSLFVFPGLQQFRLTRGRVSGCHIESEKSRHAAVTVCQVKRFLPVV